ncbi:hypothetical protein Elgi_36800 [Paenibacillus elgii]|uniref:hypothetical protein n=1 Tax=Paenibacillus elgii TaxID=189691 RepID=UPI002D7C5F91|nr:hypothetical protein Elgi_36800 [Paenibacillus elgii]
MRKEKDFNYTGVAKDFGGTEAYHFEGKYWIIGIWDTIPIGYVLLQGSLENMNGDSFHFILEDNWYFTYARVLESNYDGLGKRYTENDNIVPKYVIEKIKSVADKMLKGNAEWQAQ